MAHPPADKPDPVLPRRGARPSQPTAWWIPIVLAIVTFGVFAWACGAEFVTYDDPIHIYDNPGLLSPTLGSLGHFWTHFYQQLYIPLTYSMWWLLSLVAREPGAKSAIELNPWIFHTVSVLLQCASALLAWRLLRTLIRSALASAAGALLWAVHPLQVQSVAWVTAGKDQLCGALTLAALLLFVPSHTDRGRKTNTPRDVWATVLFAGALLAKPAAIVAPLIAAVLVVYFPQRPRRWRWLALWFGLAIADALVTHFAQPISTPADGGRWWLRPMIAANSLEFYLCKLLVPIRLMMQYPRDPMSIESAGWHDFRWAVPLIVLAGAWAVRRRWPMGLAGFLIFTAGLAPVLGLAPFDFQEVSTVSDHYAHIALLGPALTLAWALSIMGRREQKFAGAVAGAWLLLLCGLSIAQTQTWKDSYALYQYTLRVNPASWAAADNLGCIYQAANHDRQAIPLFEQALHYQTDRAAIYTNYGNSLAKTAERSANDAESISLYAKAEQAYQAANRLTPNDPSLVHNWALERKMWQAKLHAATPPTAAPAAPQPVSP